MASQTQYKLEYFTRFAKENFPTEYASIADVNLYEFERKTYLDTNKRPHHVDMLRVARYHKKANGPRVWAVATNSSIMYYWGNLTDRVLTTVSDENRNRIYYDGRFGEISGVQDTGQGETFIRKQGRFAIETVINFVFMLTDRLDYVVNTQGTDMLHNLHCAYNNLAQSMRSKEFLTPAYMHSHRGELQVQGSKDRHTGPDQVTPTASQFAMHEDQWGQNMPTNSARINASNSRSWAGPQCKSSFTSIAYSN
jgi:hypothetical protein